MQAAEVLGIKAEEVHPSVVDTDSIGYTFGTGGSRTTFATGWAAIEAARDLKNQMVEVNIIPKFQDTNSVKKKSTQKKSRVRKKPQEHPSP